MEQLPLLTLDGLELGFPGGPNVVDHVSFELMSGQTLGLIGRSGSGKSMIALAIAELLPRNIQRRGGAVSWGGIAEGRRCYSMIFQEPQQALNPTIRCGRQLLGALKSYFPELSKDEREILAREWLQKVQLPASERILRAYPHELSGGQQQRLLIAMAMAARPALLIADEPTTALDTVTELEILKLLRQLGTSEGTGMLFISHDLAVVRYLATDTLVLSQGRVVASGPTETLIQQPPNEVVKNLVKNSARLGQHIGQGQGLEMDQDVVLQAQDLSFSYTLKTNWWGQPTQKMAALQGLSFKIYKGSFTAIVGQSGCGKSTLAKCINGLLTDYQGQLSKADSSPTAVQTVFQDPAGSLNPSLTARQTLAEVVKKHQPGPPKNEVEESLRDLFARVELPLETYGNRYPEELSGGQKQRIAIARALAANPSILICDEAVSALDAELQTEIMQLLQRRCAADGLSILFVSHDLALVSRYTDHVLVMHEGQIIESGQPALLAQKAIHPQTQLLLRAAQLQ